MTTTTTTIHMTPTSIRNAVVCGIGLLGLLVFYKVLATQPARTFLVTLACLSAGQACLMPASSGNKEDDNDDKEEKEEEKEVGAGLVPDKRTEKINIDKEGDTDLESYEMVEHDLEEKDIVEKNDSATGKKILPKEPTSTTESQMMRSDTMVGVSVATDGKIADDYKKSSRKIIADESPKIIEFVEEYCDDLIDAAVAEVLNEVVSRVVGTGADQE